MLMQPISQLDDTPTTAVLTYADQGLQHLDGSRCDDLPAKAMSRELGLSMALLGLTVLAVALFAYDALTGMVERVGAHGLRGTIEQSVLVIVLGFLIFGNLVYQLARLGYLRRRAGHRPVPGDDLATFAASGLPRVVTLVPSYREERGVVAQTLLSAALQRYPSRVVLLIDDPPSPVDDDHREALEAMRLLPAEIEARLAGPSARIRAGRAGFETRAVQGTLDRVRETLDLAELWDGTAGWFYRQAHDSVVGDHTDAFFVEHILGRPQQQAVQRADVLRSAIAPLGGLEEADLVREFTALENLFDCELTSFERKRYVNLSHEPNKAMNLNSYIDLLGRSMQEVESIEGLRLVPAESAADLVVASADYVITLDADSLLSPDYALRLVYELERPGNERMAVIQTPYCAIPGSDSLLERIAGATTDIQHIFHQGSTSYGGDVVVGANAVLRRQALDDIRIVEDERGFLVARYIQDRTVIEDTESSIDLIAAGWSLHNYSDRLAVSATPADFGALVIQRRRWANGGLIILPKLARYLVSRPRRASKLAEGAVRFHYLSSIAGANIGLMILLSYPFEKTLSSPWLPLTALPYFFLYARDLRHVGYRKRDVVGVYALNLALVPINLAGVAKSIQQAITRKKVPFARTPKVSGRTRVPARLYRRRGPHPRLLGHGSYLRLRQRPLVARRLRCANIALLGYAVAFFIGLRQAVADLTAPMAHLRSARGALRRADG